MFTVRDQVAICEKGVAPRFLSHTYETVINMSADINSLVSEAFRTGLPTFLWKVLAKCCSQAGNTAFNPEKGTSNAPCLWGQAEFEAALKGNKLLPDPPPLLKGGNGEADVVKVLNTHKLRAWKCRPRVEPGTLTRKACANVSWG